MSLYPPDGGSNPSAAAASVVVDDGNRPPRLPRWTRQEILVLIQGKGVAESRVRKGRTEAGGSGSGGSGQTEPKWASVSSYCRRHGVNRGPVQCRKRWSNLAGDYKKIKEWEVNKSGEAESFWVMRNDLRRERKLPGFFDREVYDILEGGGAGGGGSESAVRVEEEKVKETDEEFSDYEQDEPEEGGEQQQNPDKEMVDVETTQTRIPVGIPISTGPTNEKQNVPNAEKGPPSQEGRKRKHCPSEDGSTRLQDKLIEVLETNSRLLTTQLEAHNLNCELDRDQRKDQTNSLVAVLGKLADSLGKIADKL